MSKDFQALARIASLAVLTLLALFLIDAAAFRTGYYARFSAENSSLGAFEKRVFIERHRKKSASHLALILGDSQVAEGLSVKLLNSEIAGGGWQFINAAVPGATPRVWYYLLRALDPEANRFDAIFLPMTQYADVDEHAELGLPPSQSLSEWKSDLGYVIDQLRLTDVPGFAGSFEQWGDRFWAWRGGLYKGLVYRRDFRDLLQHLPERKRWREYKLAGGAADDDINYAGINRSLDGMRADVSRFQFVFPHSVDAIQADAIRVRYHLEWMKVQAGETQYRMRWLGEIVRRYAGRQSRIIFFRMPQRPIPLPSEPAPDNGSFIRIVCSNPKVVVMDQHLFDDLQKPELFADGWHLNSKGREDFSRRFAKEAMRVLEARRQPQPQS